MLVGHNPELNDFLFMFTREIEHMPTCAMAELKFDVSDWTKIRQDNLQAVLFDYPKKEVQSLVKSGCFYFGETINKTV